jgi:hypothetical protein
MSGKGTQHQKPQQILLQIFGKQNVGDFIKNPLT